MRHCAFDEYLEAECRECPVCGDAKEPCAEYCGGCQEWKKNADNLKKARARRKAFGDLL